MIKGIYNENEFYTFNYWESKLKDGVRSNNKKIQDIGDRIKGLKDCSDIFWNLKEIRSKKESHDKTFKEFNSRILKSLGFSTLSEEFNTQENKYVNSYLHIQGGGSDHSKSLLCFFLREDEEGDFEQPIYSEIQEDEKKKIDDREAKEILNEDLSSESASKWNLLLTPNSMFLIEKSKWAFGRFIKVKWDEVFSQIEKEVYELIIGLFSKEALVPDSGFSLHEGLDDESHRHAFAITTELKEGVRESIEDIVNEVIYQKRKAHAKYLQDESDKYAKELTHDALFYMYRLIFLFFLEAQDSDSELLPLKSRVYKEGYSLNKLLETLFLDLQESSKEYEGLFLHHSLNRLFKLIFYGFAPSSEGGLFQDEFSETGFLVKGLKSDLFDPEKLHHLGDVPLRNGVLQKILKKLSLSEPKDKKSRRGRVSYANLGINQLGAVYEGLLSYTGFFASEDFYALKPRKVKQSDIDKGEELEQVYLAPKSLVDKYSDPQMKKRHRLLPRKKKTDEKGKVHFEEGHFVIDESGNDRIYKKGSFVYRLAGRDRQMSASYYTPESLTKCTVKYALKTLFKKKKTLEKLWKVKILEPAMGSGAFLNEAVNQLADKILEMEMAEGKVKELNPKAKQHRISQIKYKLISNNVYGVDLNPTAVELARFSLWLNCINSNQEPPDLSKKLKTGNSLISGWLKKNNEGFYPWLLSDKNWGKHKNILEDYDREGFNALREFRKSMDGSALKANAGPFISTQKKAEDLISQHFQNPSESTYQRIKKCLDFWCASFYLSSEHLEHYPKTHEAYLEVMTFIMEGTTLPAPLSRFISETATQNKFFHWELEFLEEIQDGGFDLILGNPPWVA